MKILLGLLFGITVSVCGIIAYQAIETALPNMFREVAVDSSGNLFLVEGFDNVIKMARADSNYQTTTTFGSRTIKSPVGIGVDGNGDIYVADWGGNSVKKILSVNGYSTVRSVSVTAGKLSAPCSIGVDRSGNIFFADDAKVKEILAEGDYVDTRTLPTGPINLQSGMAVDASGNLFVASDGGVKEILAEGGYATVEMLVRNAGGANCGLAVDDRDNLFIADGRGVKEILAAGGYVTVKPLIDGEVSFPGGAAIDGNGNVFVVESGQKAVMEALAEDGYATVRTVAVAEDSFGYEFQHFLASRLGIGATIPGRLGKPRPPVTPAHIPPVAKPVPTAPAEPAAPVEADVQLAIRGPDARPLPNASVMIKEAGEAGHFGTAKPPLTIITDAQGIARFRHAPGVFRLSVAADGIGYGLLGLTEFVPGEVAQPELAPLVPYAHIMGTLPLKLRKPGVVVHAQEFPSNDAGFTPPPDASGHFDFQIEGGKWWLWAGTPTDGVNESGAYSGPPVTVYPGQVLRDVTLGAFTRSAPPPPRPGSPTAEDDTVIWVHGTVRDAMGQPITGATVYALATFYGGIRMYEATAEANTDAQGYYELKGKGGLPNFSATLLATAQGKVPSWAWPRFPQAEGQSTAGGTNATPTSPPDPPVADLVLSEGSGKLNISVVADGKPASGISVAAYLENANLRDIWAAPSRDQKVRQEIENAAYPIAITGQDGVARFDHLLPGRYRIYAAHDDPRSLAQGWARGHASEPYGIAEGIAVRLGETTLFKIAVYPQPNEASFRVLSPAGTPFEGGTSLAFGRVARIEWSTSETTDKSGVGHENFEAPGLWRVDASYDAPFYAISGTLAASPSLNNEFIPSLTTRREEPASALFLVQDAAGKPLHAAVQIDGGVDFVTALGSTNERGEVRFTGLSTHGTYFSGDTARAFAPGLTPVDLGDGEAPLPGVEKLRNRRELLAQSIAADRNAETRIVFHPELVGYIYGTVSLRTGQDAALVDVYDQVDGMDPRARPPIHYRRSTGLFAAGPFGAGTVHLLVVTRDARGGQTQNKVDVAIRPGQVTQVKLAAPPPPESPADEPGVTMLGMAGLSTLPAGAHLLSSKVVLADGVTPAMGAQLLSYEGGEAEPISIAMTDATGMAQPRGLWQSSGEATEGAPNTPVIVGLLPGTTGATIVPAPKHPGGPVLLTLPPAIRMSGRVSVDGVAPSARHATIRVLAAYQGKGALDAALSVSTTADADGRFTLAGLTPGTYEVQAAMDNIWVSPSVSLQVVDRDPAPINLAIPAPGTPVLLHVRDVAGHPVAGAVVTLDRPAGPLASALWPQHWISDGAGLVAIPTLEAGQHLLRAAGAEQPVTVDVPPLPAAALDVSIALDRPAAIEPAP
jgi:protocatechuate 3,4-dioxygenase beta subunit